MLMSGSQFFVVLTSCFILKSYPCVSRLAFQFLLRVFFRSFPHPSFHLLTSTCSSSYLLCTTSCTRRSFCPRPSSSTSSSVLACISIPSSSVFVFRPTWFHPVFSLSVSSCLPLVCFLNSFLEFFQVIFVFSFISLKLAFCFPIPALPCVSAFGSSSCLTITYNKYCSCDVRISLM